MTTHYDQYLAPHLEMVRGIVRRHSYPASETADNFQSVVLVLLEHLEELGALAQGAPRKGDRHARHVSGKLAHGAFASRFSPHEGGAAVDGDAAQGTTSGFGLRLCAGAGCAVVACALGFGHGVAKCGAAARRRVEFCRNRRGDGAECAFGAPVVEPRTRTARPSTRSIRRFSAEKFGRLSVFFHFCFGLGSFFPKVYHDLVVRRTEFVPAPFFSVHRHGVSFSARRW